MTTAAHETLIWHLAVAMAPYVQGERWLAVLSPTAYLDDSGKHLDEKVICIGGLFAHAENWCSLELEWDQVLTEVPGFPGTAPPFHMADFEANGWPEKNYVWPSISAKRRFLARPWQSCANT